MSEMHTDKVTGVQRIHGSVWKSHIIIDLIKLQSKFKENNKNHCT